MRGGPLFLFFGNMLLSHFITPMALIVSTFTTAIDLMVLTTVSHCLWCPPANFYFGEEEDLVVLSLKFYYFHFIKYVVKTDILRNMC